MDLGYLGVKGIFIRSVLYCKLLEEPTSLALEGSEFEPCDDLERVFSEHSLECL